MLISKRRLQAGVVLFLAILAAFLVRPARTWIDRTVFSSVVNGQLSANEMEFHTKTSVVELRGVRWTQMANGRKYGLEAERAWLAVDPVQLVDSARLFRLTHY